MNTRFEWSDNSSPFFFPVTPFADNGEVDLDVLGEHIASRMPWQPPGVFIACGTGEYSSLDLDEYERVVAKAVQVVNGAAPVVAGAGYGAALAAQFLQRAEAAGADAALVFPPYSTAVDQAGLVAHYTSVAASTKLPIILYQRDHVRLSAATALALSEVDNILGLKDGLGDLEGLQILRTTVGDRWMYFNGMPTAELSTGAFSGIGIDDYSSATFAYLPEIATAFCHALRSGDTVTRDRLLTEFYLPFATIRDRRQGFAVSLIKAGLRYRGLAVGSVRAPLVDPSPADERDLALLIDRALALGV